MYKGAERMGLNSQKLNRLLCNNSLLFFVQQEAKHSFVSLYRWGTVLLHTSAIGLQFHQDDKNREMCNQNRLN